MSALNTEPLTVYHAFLSDSDEENSSETPCSPVLASHLQATARELESHRSVLSGRRLASMHQAPSSSSRQTSDLKQYALAELAKRDDDLASERQLRQNLESKLHTLQHERDEALQSNAAAQRREKVLRLKISSQDEVIHSLRNRVQELEADVATVNLRRQNSSNVRFVSKKPQDTQLQVLAWAESTSRKIISDLFVETRFNMFEAAREASTVSRTFFVLQKGFRNEQQKSFELGEQLERNVLLMTESRDSSRILRHFRTILSQLLRQQEEAELVPREPPIAIELLRSPPTPPSLPLPPWYPPGKSSSLSYHPNLALQSSPFNSVTTRTPSPSPRRKVPLFQSVQQQQQPIARTKSPLPTPRSTSQPRSTMAMTSSHPGTRAVNNHNNSPSVSRSTSVTPKPKTAITYLRLESPRSVTAAASSTAHPHEPRILPLGKVSSDVEPKPDVSPIHGTRSRSASPTIAVAHDIETLIKELEKWRPKH